MSEKGITMSLDSDRRAYTSKDKAVRCEEFFDGRYNVKDVYEEIDATRSTVVIIVIRSSLLKKWITVLLRLDSVRISW